MGSGSDQCSCINLIFNPVTFPRFHKTSFTHGDDVRKSSNCFFKNIDTKEECMLCFSTSKWVLHKLFAGQNHAKHAVKQGEIVFRCYSLKLVDTQKLFDSCGKCDLSVK